MIDKPSDNSDNANKYEAEQQARQVDHVMDTQGISYVDALAQLGLDNPVVVEQRKRSMRQHPASSRPPVGEDSEWEPIGELSEEERKRNMGFVAMMRASERPDEALTPLELAQRRARREKR